jgi:peptidyl-tRNA hydrolase
MQFKRPENSDKYYWTRHSVGKMMQYGLSAQRITRVIKGYKRIEEGVAEKTVAVMQPTSTRRDEDGKLKWNQEIWVMYQKRNKDEKSKTINKEGEIELVLNKKNQLKIISA